MVEGCAGAGGPGQAAIGGGPAAPSPQARPLVLCQRLQLRLGPALRQARDCAGTILTLLELRASGTRVNNAPPVRSVAIRAGSPVA